MNIKPVTRVTFYGPNSTEIRTSYYKSNKRAQTEIRRTLKKDVGIERIQFVSVYLGGMQQMWLRFTDGIWENTCNGREMFSLYGI